MQRTISVKFIQNENKEINLNLKTNNFHPHCNKKKNITFQNKKQDGKSKKIQFHGMLRKQQKIFP